MIGADDMVQEVDLEEQEQNQAQLTGSGEVQRPTFT